MLDIQRLRSRNLSLLISFNINLLEYRNSGILLLMSLTRTEHLILNLSLDGFYRQTYKLLQKQAQHYIIDYRGTLST